MSDEPKMCTTSGEPVDKVRAEQTAAVGQHKSYIVLCESERAKGFVRPYRDRYQHVGRSICAKLLPTNDKRLGGPRDICDMPNEHEGECGATFRTVDQQTHAELWSSHRIGGCGGVTTMGLALSETYARDPTFYGATFCVQCNVHRPVNEFNWSRDDTQVGS